MELHPFDHPSKHLILFLIGYNTLSSGVYLKIVRVCKDVYKYLRPFLEKKMKDFTKIITTYACLFHTDSEDEKKSNNERGWKLIAEKLPNGKQHGKYIRYCDGILDYMHTIIDNKYHGPFLVYYPDGKIKQECTYIKDRKQGNDIQYNKDGTLKKIKYFDKGVLIYVEEQGVRKYVSY